MTKNPDRDYAIAEAIAGGKPISEVAASYDLKPPRIKAIAKENAQLVRQRYGRPVPSGLTVRAATAIESALGIWPTDYNAAEIASERWQILRSPAGRRVVVREIDQWLSQASVLGF